MNESEIKKYVYKGCELEDELEEDVAKIMRKLLSAMGWPINEIHSQASVQGVNGKVRADFLVGNEVDKFIIELKSPTVPLAGERVRGQLQEYLSPYKVKYGILYNGLELLLMKQGIDKPVYEWNCREDKEDITIFVNLSKDSYPKNMKKFISDSQERIRMKNVLSENDERLKIQ
ncbi:MAG: type I restriction enzyme HsdR N-terminal domain-containing protein, partial [Conexivisphaerales archaeon]